jgi:hypothetical protein
MVIMENVCEDPLMSYLKALLQYMPRIEVPYSSPCRVHALLPLPHIFKLRYEIMKENHEWEFHVTMYHVIWVPVTLTWCVLVFRMEETASKFGG